MCTENQVLHLFQLLNYHFEWHETDVSSKFRILKSNFIWQVRRCVSSPLCIMKQSFYIRSYFIVDTTEDILAKYRRKPSASGDSTASEPGTELKAPQLVGEVEDERLSMDPANIEASYAFNDAKRKLRMVLSTADLQHVPWATDAATHIVRDHPLLLCFIENCASCRRAVGNMLMHM